MSELTTSQQAFNNGVLWSAARLIELFDEPTMAAELIRESGADVSRAEEYDKQFLDKLDGSHL